MCGRYLFDPATGDLAVYYQEAAAKARKQQPITVHEVFPSNHVVTLGANRQQEIVSGITRWGFTGFRKGHLMINARAETVENKKTFQAPFQQFRCVFPMSGFYEWNHDKEKFYFSHNEPLYVAGFYRMRQEEDHLETESIILTTEPNESVSPIHDRMPLLVDRQDIFAWINDLSFARHVLQTDMPSLHVTKV